MSKKNVLANIIISLIVGVILGILLVVLANVLHFSVLLYWGLVVVGIITIISSVPGLVNGVLNITKLTGIFDLIFSILGIGQGLMLIFMQGKYIPIILAIYLIVFPIIRIFLAWSSWKDQIKKEWVRILIGALLLAFLPSVIKGADTAFNLILMIAGYVVIGLSVLLFILSFISYIAASKKAASEAPVETTAEEIEE